MEGLHYRLSLDIRPDSLEYGGRVEIVAQGLPSSLVLDSIGHAIRSVSAAGAPLRHEWDPAARRLTVQGIPRGTGSVTIDYSGTIDDRGLRGFYSSPLGAGRLFSTYFEPAGARRLLPCLDRPAEKGIFTIDVTAPAGLTVISNMPTEATEELPEGRKRVRFTPTPPMSTYLLFVGIGPLEEIAGDRSDPRVIVAASRGRAGEGRLALREASRTVDYFSHYYGVPYPLPKLHLVAVPQFGTGAMENWGAIAFQEHLLLVGERSPISARMRFAEVLAHEIAHQWFGNLVTMRWWNDLWLNESFASFVAIKALESLYPEWNAWEDFLLTRYAGSMLWDALPHTHPVRVDVTDPDQIRQIFDEISYGKGASLLRMAEAYVGEDAFRRGVSRYLEKHRWANAEAGDLWRAVGETSAEPVERVFSEWVGRPGFPVVRARLDGGSLKLDQRRFTLLGPEPGRPWPIPLTVRVGASVHRRLFDEESTVLADVGQHAPVVNPGRSGFYRVQYEGPLQERLLEGFADLPPLDRWGIANDSLALFLSGATDLDQYLEVLRRIQTDRDPFVVFEAYGTFRFLFPLVHRIPRWEQVLRTVLIAQSERLGLEAALGEPDATRHLREGVTLARVHLDRPFAASLAAMYPRVDSLQPELRRPVLVATAVTAGPEQYAELRSRLEKAPSAEAARTVAGALGSLNREAWVRESLELLLAGKMMVGPWMDLVVSALVTNPDRSAAVWSFLVDRLDALARSAAGTALLGLLLQNAVPLLGLTRPAEMRAWVAGRTFPESEVGVAKGLDLLEVFTRTLDRTQ
ncbi:MAG: M1 family metallopeptidase [Thermoplasmata archaeon]